MLVRQGRLYHEPQPHLGEKQERYEQTVDIYLGYLILHIFKEAIYTELFLPSTYPNLFIHITHYVAHATASHPILHLTLPIITTIKLSPTATLLVPYKYA